MNTGPRDDSDPALQALASEYVLGTLDAEQRRLLEQRLPHEPALRDAVQSWEQRLHPLTALAAPVTPSPWLWRRIERSLEQEPASSSNRRRFNPLALWRGLAAAGLAASVLLASLLLLRPAPAPGYLVVLVAPQDKSPGWVVQASGTRELQLIPLGSIELPADKALEFWTKADDWQGPVSLGLVKPGQPLRVPLDHLPPLQTNQLFELTLEDRQGSALGRPTGPVQFIGRAVKTL
ncbi:RNA polymerase subunit sigma-70 [Pseudomonas sp. TKO26]|uniref:anti-sigma factor n=1 Tax=unclassified Pseudomonas TaxID=196821 RepID=UPI000D97805D|nr:MULTISPECIES: anti-sigma factor [unclassified Pseudomonas]PYY88709.1 RNA polymerase subunit sigma-70 [Pseudomonas sp. TKO30]PYY91570.1 RNA polymerase subunit sigma-70 [Pseudomonas sp. TKO29]PYY94224.1 RNA polymerase subunit sigma-70 [Pseudomonas sp. TKO26]PYZ00939.1 RNA polymerase subunit sigma-70 [Pseudomonas sp. TKO14]